MSETPITLYSWRAKCKVIALFLVMLCLALFTAPQSTLAAQVQSEKAQKHTVQVIEAANRGRWDEARKIAQASKDILASKIYFWLLFTKREDSGDHRVLKRFIRENPDWPGIPGMKAKIERSMPEGVTNIEVIAWYKDFPPESARAVDRYVSALIQNGQTAKAKKFLSDWWATTTLSRDDQRMIFRTYGSYLDRAAHMRRFDAMLLRGEYVNSRALAQVLGAGYPELAEARIGLAQEAGNIEALLARVPNILQNDAGLFYERVRWRRKNDLDTQAAQILNNPPSPEKILNPEDWWKERNIIARRFLKNRMYDKAYALTIRHGQPPGRQYAEAEWLSGWLALRFLNSPAKAFQHFQDMYKSVETPMSKTRGAYWSARAAEEMGDQETAKIWYKDAARFQNFYYGQLAGRAIGLENSLSNAAPPNLEADDLKAFQRNELMQSAQLFTRAGYKSEAHRFLRAFVDQEETPKAYRYAAEKAASIGLVSQAVRIAKDATSKGMFLTAQSYPVLPYKLRGEVEPALVHAIIRQESMFDTDALSPAGASGLMQLMPATARETAKKIGVAHEHEWLTTKPEHNIRLGSHYLQRLIDRFDGTLPMAIAGYNAGPGRVNDWIEDYGDPRYGQLSMIDWIEMIPIYETRNYVQRVIENVYVYRLRLNGYQGQRQQLVDQNLMIQEQKSSRSIRVHTPTKKPNSNRAYNN